jgi:lysophospholipase L1-like esterase
LLAATRLKKAFFSLFAFAAGLGLLNVGAVVYEILPYGVRTVNGQPVGLYSVGAGAGRPQLAKGARLQGTKYQIAINSLGFRGPELLESKPANGIRVWATGGSTTFDILAPNDASTWPAVAGRELQARHPDKVVEVINAGIPGEVFWGSGQDLNRLWRKVQPDVVIVYHGINDLRKAATQSLPPQGHMAAAPIDLAILRVMRRKLAVPRAIPSNWSDRRLSRHQLDLVRRELNNFVAIPHKAGIPVLMATHALRLDQKWTPELANRDIRSLAFLLQMSPAAVAESVDLYNGMVRRVAEERGFSFVDLRTAVPADREYWGDSCHFSGKGSALAGAAVADALDAMIPALATTVQ